MEIINLTIQGCFLLKPKIFGDERGIFFEWFQDSTLSELTGVKFNLAQANCSISNFGVIRGIHFAGSPPGQAKYVTCLTGKVFDVVVDCRVGSSTFGKWESVILDSENPQMLYIPDGVGHGFMSLTSQSTFVYLCDERYNPTNEFEINAFDPQLDIAWPDKSKDLRSKKDQAAENFSEAIRHMPNMKDLI